MSRAKKVIQDTVSAKKELSDTLKKDFKIKADQIIEDALEEKRLDDYKTFVEMLIENDFNVRKTCRDASISKSKYYTTYANNPDFLKIRDEMSGSVRDTIRSAMLEGILHSDLNVRKNYLAMVSERYMRQLFNGVASGFEDDDKDDKPSGKFEGTIEFE